MDGGKRVARVLEAHGVPFVFTLCGGHISPILVEAENAGIRVIDVRHEANAVFAADAVGRLTGVPGVAAVTAGPGVTNTITAIKNAQLAQSPLVLLGGATATVLRGRGSLQDIDQLELIRPHVKWSARPNTLRQVIPALEQAFHEAVSGVPGPVFVELAVDLLYDEATVRDWYRAKTDSAPRSLGERLVQTYLKAHLLNQFVASSDVTVSSPAPADVRLPKDREVRAAAKLLDGAERPVMVLGSQTMLRPTEVEALVAAVEALGLPVYLSGMARGLLGKDHPLQLRHKRSKALREADVVLLSGVPCDFRLDYGSHIGRAKLVAVNRCEKDLHKNRKPDVAVHADPHAFLVALGEAARSRRDRSSWLATLKERDAARNTEIAEMAEEPTEYVNPLVVCQALEAKLADDSLIVVDGGDFVATASYIAQPRRPLSWLDPGVFGTLGVGAGFALGAKLVRPDADVWLLYGDGSAGFSLSELDTFVRHEVPVIALVGNDAGWTQIARDQVEILGSDTACGLRHTDYHEVAKGFGAKGYVIRDPKTVDRALTQALEASRGGQPVLVNALIGKTDFRKGSLSM